MYVNNRIFPVLDNLTYSWSSAVIVTYHVMLFRAANQKTELMGLSTEGAHTTAY